MGNERCFLITVLYGSGLLRCALKVHEDKLDDGMVKYPMSPVNREKFHKLLPLHVRSCGPIVEINTDYLFEIHFIN